MPKFRAPNSASLHAARFLLDSNWFFLARGRRATFELNPRWSHMEPLALAMGAAWGAWCRRQGYEVKVENLGPRARYAARMRLFDHLGVPFVPGVQEHEEAGRFLPVTQVNDTLSLRSVMADISALLHLQDDSETLAAVQYCISELLRNVLEHAASPDGAFVCAHNFAGKALHRVSLAVVDSGCGIREQLSRTHSEAAGNDAAALHLALRPGVTGAVPGMYGTPDNAGAGLFITRCMAKGSGGYFLVASGQAGYRLRRANDPQQQEILLEDPLAERHDSWRFRHPWQGTIVALEIRTDHIGDFDEYFAWIRQRTPRQAVASQRVRFT